MDPKKLAGDYEEEAGTALLSGSAAQRDPKVYPLRWYILSIFVVFW